MYSKYLFVTIASLLATIVVGCSEPTDCKFDFYESIQIVTGTPNDTLLFLPGDSASTTVTVIVTDASGQAFPGQKVDISLSNPSLGVIEFTDLELMDTTNASGRVNAMFRSFGIEGQTIIAATTGGLVATDTLIIREAPQAITSVTFVTDCDSLIALPDRPDSCEICATVRDANNQPVAGIAINLFATGGRFTVPPATDANGRTCFYMYLRDGNFGYDCVIVYSDSICFYMPG